MKIDIWIIGEKAEHIPEVIDGLAYLEETLSPQEFEIFCEYVPEGQALRAAFLDAAGSSDNPDQFGWKDFAIQIFKNNRLDLMTPRSCLLSLNKKAEALRRSYKELLRLGSAVILAAHCEEPKAVSQVSKHLCRGCAQRECVHRFGWQEFPKTL